MRKITQHHYSGLPSFNQKEAQGTITADNKRTRELRPTLIDQKLHLASQAFLTIANVEENFGKEAVYIVNTYAWQKSLYINLLLDLLLSVQEYRQYRCLHSL